MFNVICDALISGTINFIDTASNFRYRKSERVVGAALRYLLKEKYFQREEIIIGSKGGFIAEDADLGITASHIIKDLLNRGVISSEAEIYNMNCIEPEFISHQFEESLNNIGLNTLDFYSINLPEFHLTRLTRPEFFKKLLVI